MTIRFLVACLALFGTTGIAKAEINSGEAIEWIVADSDRVIVGKTTKVEKSNGQDIVTVNVSKTIRGKHEETIRFTTQPGGSAANWQKAGVPILFCLVNRDRSKDAKELPDPSLVLRHGPGYVSAFPLGKADQRESDVFTREFGVLTDADAIVKYVEAYSKTIPADWKRKSIRIGLPGDTPAFKKLWAGSAVYFTLPVDAALEAQGKKWCASKRGDNRVLGIASLKEYPSEPNIKILKGLLTDENVAIGSGKKYYYVRTKAFEALRDLGVTVERPILEEPEK